MSTPVVMPHMGESIAEGTIVRWIKKIGDAVDRDEPLFEISTDKVDAEIPSPAAGVLLEIAVQEGETVPVNSVVATIGSAGESAGSAAGPAPSPAADGDPAPTSAAAAAPAPAAAAAPAASPAASPAPQRPTPAAPAPARAIEAGGEKDGGADRQRLSPLVRRIAKEHNVDVSQIAGSGIGGRVTKQDILAFIESGGSGTAVEEARPSPVAPPP